MRRPVWFRVLIGVWGIWLGAVVSEPAGLHSCPMHGEHAMHAAGSPVHFAGTASRHDSHSNDQKPKLCTCLGAGCCAAVVVAPSAKVAELAEAAAVVRVPIAPAREDHAPAATRAYSHPFANGPPAPRSV